LMIPHITRSVVGPQYRKLLPITAMLGGMFLLIIDDIVRSVSVIEIPIGLAISFIGAPFFYMLIKKGKKR
ncbi:MAG: iron chelate uptake ABC transporter family permease subunit, partial [Clostridiales bacterium]|nr:iron chelate uptake ABC transporter family permease subunit [Clostridiales bacterium]